LERELTQGRVAELAKIPQATLSAWETARQLPDEDPHDPRLQRLAHSLGCTLEDLLSALRAQPRARGYSFGASDDAYVDIQQAFLADECGYQADVWLLGPETLRVYTSGLFRSTWLENLRKGVNYNVVWLLCLAKEDHLRNLTLTLRNIGNELQSERGAGEIIHHACILFSDDSEDSPLAQNEKDYNSLRPGGIPGNRFKNPLTHALGNRLMRELRRYFPSYGSVTVCIPRDAFAKRPIAAVNLPAVSPSLGGVLESVWHFLPPETARVLGSITERLTAAESSDAHALEGLPRKETA